MHVAPVNLPFTSRAFSDLCCRAHLECVTEALREIGEITYVFINQPPPAIFRGSDADPLRKPLWLTSAVEQETV